MEADTEKDLLKGNKERWNPIGKILAGHFVGPFQNVFTGQEAEEELKQEVSFRNRERQAISVGRKLKLTL